MELQRILEVGFEIIPNPSSVFEVAGRAVETPPI